MSQTAKKDDSVHPKSFQDLIIEVHDKGLCGFCGGSRRSGYDQLV